MLDIITILVIIANIFIGYRNGIVDMVLSIAAYIIAILFARLFHSYVASFLSATPIYDSILEWVADSISIGGTVQDITTDIQAQIIESIPLPPIFSGMINLENMIDISTVVDTATLELQIASSITDLLINIIAALLVFLLLVFGLRIIIASLNTIAMLPVIRVVNKNLGALVGAVRGFLIVWLLLIMFNLVLVRPSNIFEQWLYSSHITYWLSERNFILSVILGAFN